ncbi:MAG TPA: DUF2911 domain-containing protein [Bryobacteraceae bacterium]|nr:DUF2911 domain-containing protein [Bryobacteraceae bacterium]
MNKSILGYAVATMLMAGAVQAQPPRRGGPPLSPPAETSVTIAGKAISVKYSAPSVRGRQMFGEGGVISKDRTYPVWRLGANSATTLHTEADLEIGGVTVPKGDYTLFALVNATPWQLIINKQTGQWGLSYDRAQDVGRAPMNMSKPAAPVETCRITLSSTGTNSGLLQVEFENVIASVPFTVK